MRELIELPLATAADVWQRASRFQGTPHMTITIEANLIPGTMEPDLSSRKAYIVLTGEPKHTGEGTGDSCTEEHLFPN